MDNLREVLLSSEPLLLFLVIGIGLLIGQIRVRGFSLGVAGILFVGLAFGGWHPEGQPAFTIASQVTQIGLILFVYAVGLISGPGFFASLQSRGLRFNLALVASLAAGGVATFFLGRLMDLPIGQIAGVFCGGLTNTPALAAVTELMNNSGIGNAHDPAVGYSLAYPFGVIGGMLAFEIFRWGYRRQFDQEAADAEAQGHEKTRLNSASFEISNPELFDRAIGELRVQDRTGLIISRHRHGNNVAIPTKYSVLRKGDVVTVVGTEGDVRKHKDFFGKESKVHLVRKQERIVMRRILVSKKGLAGRTIEKLDLQRRFNAQITRLRRADIDIVARPDAVIELGDRLRVVMPAERADDIAKYFGDSERDVSAFDYVALTLGISLGVLFGMIPIPIPGGSTVSLGFAGGPLVVGLILGKLGRSGPLVWSIPLESNHTLRYIGLVFFMAGVGIMAGDRFFGTLNSNGWQLFLLGMITTSLTTGMTLLLLRHYGKATVISAIGATSGMQTQPATLARAYEISNKSDETYVAYATTYPVAMVGKILIAQLLVIMGSLPG